MKTRDQALQRFKEFQIQIELMTAYGENIKAIRTDNAMEYCGDDFESFLRENGIHHEVSTPSYWEEEACKAAAFVRSTCATAALQYEMTPEEALTARKPDVCFLRTWGCRVYALVPEQLRKKFADRRVEAILIGYEPGRKAYRLVDLRTRRLFISKDVNFDERVLGYCNILNDSSEPNACSE